MLQKRKLTLRAVVKLEPLDVEDTHEPIMVIDVLKEFTNAMPS